MTTWKNAAALTILGVSTLAGPAWAQATATKSDAKTTEIAPKSDKKADEILSKSVEFAFGDSDDYRNVVTVHATGEMSMPAMGVEGTMELWMDIENGNIRTKSVIPGITTEQQGIYHDISWADSTINGPRLLEEEESAQMVDQVDFYGDADFENTYSIREYMGTDTVDGEKAHKVRLVRATDDSERTRWYADNGRLVKEVSKVVSPMGIIEVTSNFSDYKDVGAGAQVPFKITSEMSGFKQELVFTAFEVNENVKDSNLKPPADVQKLIDQMESEEKASDDAEG